MGKLIEEPKYIKHRLDMFAKLYAKQQEELQQKPSQTIKMTLPDGSVKDADTFRTSPYDIAKGISQGLAQSAVIAKVNGVLWDMTRPLVADATLEFLKFSDPDGQETFWHSSAHFLGQALELKYGGDLAYGPPIADGFFYDMRMPEGGKTIKVDELQEIEDMITKMSKEKQAFERLVISKTDLLEMFKFNPFKQRIIREKVEDEYTTAYRCGPLIDLCRGPHIRNAGQIKGLSIHKPTSSYWEGNADAEALQRVYGITFPEKQMIKDWKVIQEEAAKRDHRKIGKEHDLFFFNELSAGSAFFTPRGAHIYLQLVGLQRQEYHKRGFSEVITPNIFSTKLWKTSGHYQHYKDNMFLLSGEKPNVVADEELKALNDKLKEKEDALAAEKKRFSEKLKALEAQLKDADDKLRKEVEGVINKMKAHPPISVRRASHARDAVAAELEKKLESLVESATEKVNKLNETLVDKEFELEEALVEAADELKKANLGPGEMFFARKTLLAADSQLPADSQVFDH